MPFNEVWLPLIRIAFPHAPVVHLVRHPLDVCVSMMSHQLNHGFHCGYRLEDTAHYLAAVHRLHEHYRRELEPREFILRYESLVANPRRGVDRLLEHVGLPFDEACLRFHEQRPLRADAELRAGGPAASTTARSVGTGPTRRSSSRSAPCSRRSSRTGKRSTDAAHARRGLPPSGAGPAPTQYFIRTPK